MKYATSVSESLSRFNCLVDLFFINLNFQLQALLLISIITVVLKHSFQLTQLTHVQTNDVF